MSNPKDISLDDKLAKIAAALELIHMSSLIHDDVIDMASLRHNRPTINCRWNQDVSIALGDYLYSIAFELVSSCGNTDILQCISSATRAMCEGELHQVCERKNLHLLKKDYFIIIKKKTAGLFAASCLSGAMISCCSKPLKSAVKQYGLNFGIAFQILDDCLDLISQKKDLGKSPGADFKMGELTLPVLNLLAERRDENRLISLMEEENKEEAFGKIKQRFLNSGAMIKTKKDISKYIEKAKKNLNSLNRSCFKQSLYSLAGCLFDRTKQFRTAK